jgi:hypothetical protein
LYARSSVFDDPELIEAIRDEGTRLRCLMTMGEIGAFDGDYHAKEYRLDVRRLMAWGVELPDEEEE